MASDFEEGGVGGDLAPLELGYAELAARLSLSPSRVRALAQRRRWPRRRDASGRIVLSIDASELARIAGERLSDAPISAASDRASDSLDRISKLVAAIRAERGVATPPCHDASPGALNGAAVAQDGNLAAMMRQLLAARDREKAGWARAMQQLASELTDAKAMIAKLRDDLARTAVEHRRAVTELEASHSDQRSIWQLERRRLEITIAGLEKKRRKRWPLHQGLRPARIVAVMIASLGAIILSQDAPPPRLDQISRSVDGFAEHAAWTMACASDGGCAPLPNPASREPTRFLVEGFLRHMAQQLSVGSNPGNSAEP